ncbi:MAG: cation diffusion facilitator family transporter [Caldimicrobium sp.]|nr:cation diffusion facilitator family transporter [Caldimicrobium sp.]MCX7614017.1 cation diffusion facilitator family transporter [Caldimicrobium sp.]MDW8182884.1 cation diffusion facilitator family transporter [Caldimicrobium sp.]
MKNPYSPIKSKAKLLTLLSFIFSIFICLLKFLAYYLTQSVAIYSDAMESIVNIFSAFLAMIGTKIALKPSDAEHPYGHTKVEYIIAIVESLFILLASISIFWEAWQSFSQKRIPENLDLGTLFLLLGTIINLSLAYAIYRQGKIEASPILISHASHLFTDVITTFGILIGIILATLTGFWYLDPLLAVIISFNILYLGYKILKDALNSLMDVSLSKEKIDDIHRIIEESLRNYPYKNIYIFDFKSRKAGRKNFVEFNLALPGELTVRTAHELCDKLEQRILENYPEVHVIIHVEPNKIEEIT